MNNDLRLKIAEMTYNAGEGHIPSAYSIIDILEVLYSKFLRYDPKNPNWQGRDYFILSKGHGCAALWAVLEKHGFITEHDLNRKGKEDGILGGHPDATRVPGVEASTGSLGHGIAMTLGIALGLRISKKPNRVIALIGDGECNEGIVWECALVTANLKLGNLCVIVDDNGSAAQVLPVPNPRQKWEAFGWEVYEVDGHSPEQVEEALTNTIFEFTGKPKVIIANTLKGKGVSFVEGHGVWHSKVPNAEEMEKIRAELTAGLAK